MTSVDDLVEGINTKLLEPLRENWFSGEDGEGMSGTFLDPLVEKVLDPLEEHLDSLAELADTVQSELASSHTEGDGRAGQAPGRDRSIQGRLRTHLN